jgi:hypothetical protein
MWVAGQIVYPHPQTCANTAAGGDKPRPYLDAGHSMNIRIAGLSTFF